jgi:transposase InsO family protein
MIFEFMKANSAEFEIEKMAKIFKVSRAGYYRHINKKQSIRAQETKALTEKIKLIHKRHREVYGSPRICAVLNKMGDKCSRKRVAKIMHQNNIQAKMRKVWKFTTKSFQRPSHLAPNLIKQNFSASAKNKTWVSDITYVRTREGWLYVSAILDLYSRTIVGLSMGDSIDSSLVIGSLKQAICHRKPKAGLIVHTDRGCQYTSSEYQQFLSVHGIIPSMSAAGYCYDNAAMESFFHTLKTELVYRCNFDTRKNAVSSIFEYVEVFYNRNRIHSTLNYLSPLEFEQKNSLAVRI